MITLILVIKKELIQTDLTDGIKGDMVTTTGDAAIEE